MKAAVIDRYGAPDVFRLTELEAPRPGPTDVLVAVHAAAINPVDYKIRQGTQRAVVRRSLPTVLGLDCSGVVEAVGDEVEAFAPGDEVFASPNHKRNGTYAELTLVDQSELARKPPRLSHEEAASLPLVGLTAWGCLVGRVEEGDRVLIQAGSGGVGTFAIQLAKHLGARVSTTCSGRNEELVRSLGADRVVDYTKEQFWDVLEPQDVALDALGGPERKRLRQIVRRGGRLVSINSELPRFSRLLGPYLGLVAAVGKMAGVVIWSRLVHGVKVSLVVRRSDGAALAAIADLVEQGAIEPVVDRVFELDAIAEAHTYLETGRARGKVVISVR